MNSNSDTQRSSQPSSFDLAGTFDQGSQIIKNILIVGVVGGIVFVIMMVIKYLNSPAGKAIEQLFGGLAAAMQGLASALNFMTGQFNQCTQGKDNDGSSVSGAKQALSCLSLLGILAGLFIGVPALAAGLKYLYNRLRPGSEEMKTMEEQVKQNLEKTLDSEGDTYKALVEKVKQNLDQNDNYDDTEDGRAALQNDAELIVNKVIMEKGAKVISDNAKDIAKKSKNSSDERKVAEAQEKYQSEAQAKSAAIRDIATERGIAEDDVQKSADDINDDVEKAMNEDIA